MRPTSPKNTLEKEIGIFFTEEMIAAATAKSKAGSASLKNQIDMLKLKNEICDVALLL